MAAQLGIEGDDKNFASPGIAEVYEDASDDDEPSFSPAQIVIKREPDFLSTISLETKTQIEKVLNETLEKEKKLTTETRAYISKHFKITTEQVKEYYDFLCQSNVKTLIFSKFTNDEIRILANMEKDALYKITKEVHQQRIKSTLAESLKSNHESSSKTGSANVAGSPLVILTPIPITRAETGPGKGVELGSIISPPALFKQVTGGEEPVYISEDDKDDAFIGLQPMAMIKQVTGTNEQGMFGESYNDIAENIELDIDDYDAPSFTPENTDRTFSMSPPVMKKAITISNNSNGDNEVMEDIVEADHDDPDEPVFAL